MWNLLHRDNFSRSEPAARARAAAREVGRRTSTRTTCPCPHDPSAEGKKQPSHKHSKGIQDPMSRTVKALRYNRIVIGE